MQPSTAAGGALNGAVPEIVNWLAEKKNYHTEAQGKEKGFAGALMKERTASRKIKRGFFQSFAGLVGS
ncbi:hypothetical protein Nepgr_023435 [Nepenthes gracilis]|uniref:Uncharacterized protein n=1 Tax=Nepenthes gracilis TaxID=150966 RepID=A0AAD3T219_NEPGR|nr:hypothetical protein Nepgr_023435 [Nepenthes gracilis]